MALDGSVFALWPRGRRGTLPQVDMDPTQALKLAKLLKIAPELLKLYRASTGNDNSALAEVLRRGDAAYFDHIAHYVEYHESRLCRLEVQYRELQDSVVRLRDSPDDQEVRLLFNLRWEAAREATDERKEMLAAAAAAMMVSRASVEDRARVERTLRQLDPIDVRVLHGIDRITGRNARERYKRSMTQERRSVLQAAGCVDIDYGPLAGFGGVGVPELSVSFTGALVLKFLRAYLRKVGPAFEDPVRFCAETGNVSSVCLRRRDRPVRPF